MEKIQEKYGRTLRMSPKMHTFKSMSEEVLCFALKKSFFRDGTA